MKNRYNLVKEIQTKYFQQIETASKLHPNRLAALFGVVPRTYRDWRRGKFAIPQNVIIVVEKRFRIRFPISKSLALKRWKALKTKASRRGGIALMKKYGSPGTPEGRSKGGKRGMQTLRERGLIPQPKPFIPPNGYSSELAEFVGILLGDGHIGKEQWSITLNAKADKLYANFVYKLTQQLFHFRPSKYIRDDCNVIIISGSGVRSIQFLTSLGLKIGNKVKQQVDVPKWIKDNPSYCLSCLRGLVDTDGGIFNHSYRVNGKTYSYRKLNFVNRSMPLLQFAKQTLITLGFTPKMIDKVANKRVWLYNQQEVIRYLKVVSSHNHRVFYGGVR